MERKDPEWCNASKTIPINPTKCNYFAIGRDHPLQFSFAAESPGDSKQVINVDVDLIVLMDRSFSSPVHAREVVS